MTTEVQTQITLDEYSEVDYFEVLADIRDDEQEQTELLNAYLPEIHNVCVLFLGSFIALTVFRLLTSFFGRVFNDTTKL